VVAADQPIPVDTAPLEPAMPAKSGGGAVEPGNGPPKAPEEAQLGGDLHADTHLLAAQASRAAEAAQSAAALADVAAQAAALAAEAVLCAHRGDRAGAMARLQQARRIDDHRRSGRMSQPIIAGSSVPPTGPLATIEPAARTSKVGLIVDPRYRDLFLLGLAGLAVLLVLLLVGMIVFRC